MPTTVTRQKTINLRASEAQKAIIKRAADAAGKTATAFVLDATMERAESVLADRLHFELPDEQMDRFLAALSAPSPAPDALRKLLARHPQWAR